MVFRRWSETASYADGKLAYEWKETPTGKNKQCGTGGGKGGWWFILLFGVSDMVRILRYKSEDRGEGLPTTAKADSN